MVNVRTCMNPIKFIVEYVAKPFSFYKLLSVNALGLERRLNLVWTCKLLLCKTRPETRPIECQWSLNISDLFI